MEEYNVYNLPNNLICHYCECCPNMIQDTRKFLLNPPHDIIDDGLCQFCGKKLIEILFTEYMNKNWSKI